MMVIIKHDLPRLWSIKTATSYSLIFPNELQVWSLQILFSVLLSPLTNFKSTSGVSHLFNIHYKCWHIDVVNEKLKPKTKLTKT